MLRDAPMNRIPELGNPSSLRSAPKVSASECRDQSGLESSSPVSTSPGVGKLGRLDCGSLDQKAVLEAPLLRKAGKGELQISIIVITGHYSI